MAKTYKFSNKELVQILKEILAAMEVKNFNIFRIRAYQNAIGAIEASTISVYDLWQSGRLKEIPGVGGGLEQHLIELFTTGEVKDFKQYKYGLPPGMFALIGLRGVGAKRAFKLAKEFKLYKKESAIEKLKEAAELHKVQELEGFGEKSEAELLNAINETKMTKNQKKRLLLIKAEDIVERLIPYIQSYPGTEEVVALGSYRRKNPTVGDLDIAAVHEEAEGIMQHFLKYPEIEEVLAQGEKKISAVFTNDVQVDFRVTPKKAFGSMLQYSTGNKQHNVLLRTYGLEQGKSLSEYGIKYQDKLHEFSNEEDFYKFLGLDWIPPEIRQGKEEIELARKKKLPNLVKLEDIKGDLHTHTVASDGLNTLSEMVNAAKALGYSYFGIADHAPSVQSRGLDEVHQIVDRQRKNIDALNDAQNEVKVLFGYEVNILADCTLSLPDEVMEKLDYVIASVHTAFNQDREMMTERVIKTLENPYVTILGHPGGRLINERDFIDIDWNAVFKAAVDNNKIIEINGQPNRLDLAEDLVKEAKERGVKLIINTDAHTTGTLSYMRYGVNVARRGWCEKKDIINTLELGDFLEQIRRT